MKTRVWCLLLGAAYGLGAWPVWAQNVPAAPEKESKQSASQSASAAGVPGSWAVDFWTRWPIGREDFFDVIFGGSTDALAHGYYLDPRSISPDQRFGVIVPRFGIVREAPNFLVEIPARRVAGVLDGAGFAFAPKAEVGWSYQWSADSTALVIEQAGVSPKGWVRQSWRLVEVRDGYVSKQTDLLKTPAKTPPWVDAKAPPAHDRSEPPASSKAPLVLAQSSSKEDAWSVQRDGNAGPLFMVKGGARVCSLPPIKTVGEDAKGALREISGNEMPGLPLCFFAPDERWLFVNQISRTDPETGRQWRSAALYWRNDDAEDKKLTWKVPFSGTFEDLIWEGFIRRNSLAPQTVAPPDANGFRDRSIEFVNWSEKSGRILLYLRARNATVTAKDVKPAYYRAFCYFDTARLAFDAPFELDSSNDELRTRWNSSNESLTPKNIPLRVGDPGGSALFAPYDELDSFADGALNSSYKAVLERLGKDAVEETRKVQRAWLAYRDTIARVHVLNRWTSFPDYVLHEGQFLATRRRADVLREEALALHKGPNTVVREKSPDGKFGVLYTYADDNIEQDGNPQGASLVSLPDRKELIDFYEEGVNRSMNGSWSPDSRYLAYHSGTRRMAGFTVYERRGNTFTALKMPDLEGYQPKTKKNERSYHFDGSDLELKRWLGGGKIRAHYSIQFDVSDGSQDRTVAADFDMILAIEKGKVVIEKATRVASDSN